MARTMRPCLKIKGKKQLKDILKQIEKLKEESNLSTVGTMYSLTCFATVFQASLMPLGGYWRTLTSELTFKGRTW